MSENQWKIHLFKEAHKFSAAHMTVFPDGSKEALHGHNYYLSVTLHLKSIDFETTVPFSSFKKELKRLCDLWDEKILLATKNRFSKISQKNGECEAVVCGKRYIFPADEVVLLEIENVSSESLAQHFGESMVSALASTPTFANVTALELRVDESKGQGASFFKGIRS